MAILYTRVETPGINIISPQYRRAAGWFWLDVPSCEVEGV